MNVSNEQREIQELEDRLARKKASIINVQNNCSHSWGSVIDASIYTPGYTIPGDPPGTMGIDWRGPVYVDSKTEHRWKRICKNCNKEEVTTQTNKTVVETPKF
jgi:hypothetical protein